MKYRVFYAPPHAMARSFLSGGIDQVIDPTGYTEVVTTEARGLEELFRAMNVVDGDELPMKLQCRSMSVGDVAVEEDGTAWLCGMFGWNLVSFDPK